MIRNTMLEQAKAMLEQEKQEVRGIRYQNMFNAVHNVKNEVVEKKELQNESRQHNRQ